MRARTLVAVGWCWLCLSCGAPAAQNAPESPAREDGEAPADEPAGGEAEADSVSEKKPSSLRDEPEPTTVEEAERMLADELGRLEGMLSTTELSAGGCPKVCRALSSMERSVLAICELAGEGDDRCKKARAKLDDARTRVAGAPCVCNG